MKKHLFDVKVEQKKEISFQKAGLYNCNLQTF